MARDCFESQESCPYSAGPPWIFRGRAFYQIHLVKADVAKRFIPSELKIVQAFGYTLGGFYLAQYDSSPAGVFDELVVIAGTVWNPPTSCAWAARVLVNSTEACNHGKKEVGLPSKFASFSQSEKPFRKKKSWWSQWNSFSSLCPGEADFTHKQRVLDISEVEGLSERPMCSVVFPFNRRSSKDKQFIGPSISISLPSFSGKTIDQPELLKYSCQLKCSMRAVKPATIQTPMNSGCMKDLGQDYKFKSILAILESRPIIALCFEKMIMHVDAPKTVNDMSGVSGSNAPRTGPAAIAVRALKNNF
ncbi:hypothetical protein KP509_1Z013800 [Ceratopteris richardii]|nr:hypothetical protein KP509_1Z013800 [Ceratopteris richardii]KAH6559319.1 hypothetical protein KP509_1Z013800 [Ceratopteris richardii]